MSKRSYQRDDTIKLIFFLIQRLLGLHTHRFVSVLKSLIGGDKGTDSIFIFEDDEHERGKEGLLDISTEDIRVHPSSKTRFRFDWLKIWTKPYQRRWHFFQKIKHEWFLDIVCEKIKEGWSYEIKNKIRVFMWIFFVKK